MVHVRNHRHVTDVGLLVHDGTDLVDGEVHLKKKKQKMLYLEAEEKTGNIIFTKLLQIHTAMSNYAVLSHHYATHNTHLSHHLRKATWPSFSLIQLVWWVTLCHDGTEVHATTNC